MSQETPLLYSTTKDFLEFFNLKSLDELPTLKEYHELAQFTHRTNVNPNSTSKKKKKTRKILIQIKRLAPKKLKHKTKK